MMRYRDLLAKLNTLSPQQLAKTVALYDTVNDSTVTLDIADFAIMGEEDDQDCRPEPGTLRKGHPYIVTV